MAIRARRDLVQRPLDLLSLRQALSLTQSEMAARMGLGARAYQGLESEASKVSARHIKLAEMVAFEIACERKAPMLAPGRIRGMALDLAGMLRGE